MTTGGGDLCAVESTVFPQYTTHVFPEPSMYFPLTGIIFASHPSSRFEGNWSLLATACNRLVVSLHFTEPWTGACGKTSLLCSFALGEFPKEYVGLRLSSCFVLTSLSDALSIRVSALTSSRNLIQFTSLHIAVFDNYVAEIRLDEKPVQLALWDTAYALSLCLYYRLDLFSLSGQEEYEVRTLYYSLNRIFCHIHGHFSVFVQCHTQSLMSSLLLLPWIHPTRWRMSPQRHIILTYTALFIISLFFLSGSKKFAASVALPFPSSLLDAKLICDHQLLILIPRITLVRGWLVKRENEWPTQLGLEHTKSVRLWKSKVSMMSLKLRHELACSWEMVYPTTVKPLTVGNTIGEEVAGRARLRTKKRVKTGAVVLFVEKVCGLPYAQPLIIFSFFSPSIFFDRFFNSVNTSLD